MKEIRLQAILTGGYNRLYLIIIHVWMLLLYYSVKVFPCNLVISAFRTGRTKSYYTIWIENNYWTLELEIYRIRWSTISIVVRIITWCNTFPSYFRNYYLQLVLSLLLTHKTPPLIGYFWVIILALTIDYVSLWVRP